MTQPARLSALRPAPRTVVAAAPRLGLKLPAWSGRVRARILRAATVVVIGSLAVVLALSLVGVSGGAAPWSPTIRGAVLASIGIAALLIRGARNSAAARR
jgi:hypothetical protein